MEYISLLDTIINMPPRETFGVQLLNYTVKSDLYQ